MHPANREFMAPRPDHHLRHAVANPTGSRGVIRSQSHIRRPTSDESWIEVSSQPSSSSLSSVAPDEVITTGLRVTQSVNPRRRQRLRRSSNEALVMAHRLASSQHSSPEEYDESESGSDANMTSSGLDDPAHFLDDEVDDLASMAERISYAVTGEGGIGSDDGTALGVAEPSPLFTPQPNAFSHPPSMRMPPRTTPASTDSYFPSSTSTDHPTSSAAASTPPTSTSSIPTRAHTRTRSHTPYTLLAPSHTVSVDHDAALRASLSTLLSCAAAARGLPKRDVSHEASAPAAGTSRAAAAAPQAEPGGGFRLISESALDRAAETEAAHPHGPAQARTNSSASPGPTVKRRAPSPARERRKKRRGVSEPADPHSAISPTLTTWVVGAGVMVLFSAISFSAGYALGREVGHVEAAHMSAAGIPYDVDPASGAGLWERSAAGIRSRVLRWGNGSGIRV